MTSSPFLELFVSLTLKREGRTYKTCCPFHDDKTPSLSVDPEKGLWRCFGCGEAGDAITFLQKMRGLEFGEAADVWREMSGEEPKYRKQEGELMGAETKANGAVKRVAAKGKTEAERDRWSVKPTDPPESPAAKDGSTNGQAESGPVNAGQLLGRMAELYTKGLAKSKAGLAYLEERGIANAEMMRDFRLGYVDGSCAKLVTTPEHREALTELGILNAKGTETLYGCVVVPLTDRDGGVTGFLGRRVKASENPHDHWPPQKTPQHNPAFSMSKRPGVLRTANWFWLRASWMR